MATSYLQVAKVSLNPAKQTKKKVEPPKDVRKNDMGPSAAPPQTNSHAPQGKFPSYNATQQSAEQPPESVAAKGPPPKVFNIIRSSKYRHIQGGTMHRSTHIEKLPKLSVSIPGDSNGFQVGREEERERERGREGEREGVREGVREGGWEGGREKERGVREGGREGGREKERRGSKGGREGEREGVREGGWVGGREKERE